MKKTRLFLMALLLISVLVFTACGSKDDNNDAIPDDQQNSVEQDVEDGIDDVEDDVEDGAKDLEKDAEDLGNDIKDGVDDMEDDVNDGTENSNGNAVDNNGTGTNMQ
ncbi:MAG: hypothetical protein ACLU5F_10275 [Anaerovoracaceae bacterium]